MFFQLFFISNRVIHYMILKDDLLLEPDPSKYAFINQGVLTIDGVDDCQEMRDTKKAVDILNFSQVKHINCS